MTAADMLIRDVRVSERLRAFVAELAGLHRRLNEIAEVDPELAPEIVAMSDGLFAAGEAATRAVVFLNARLDARP